MRCGADARGSEAVLFAFDLIEHDGDDLRDLPLIERANQLICFFGFLLPRVARCSLADRRKCSAICLIKYASRWVGTLIEMIISLVILRCSLSLLACLPPVPLLHRLTSIVPRVSHRNPLRTAFSAATSSPCTIQNIAGFRTSRRALVGAAPAAEGLALSKHLRQRMFALSRRVEQDHLDGAVRVRGARGRPKRIRAGRHRVEAGGCALSFR
jgi:hypothetical protein